MRLRIFSRGLASKIPRSQISATAQNIPNDLAIMAPRISGLQKQVHSLYRRLLKEAVKKDQRANNADMRLVELLQIPGTTSSYAKAEFRQQAKSVKRSDFGKIEYMIRKGEKHLKLLQMPGVDLVSGTATLS
jgi:Complex 1 protein (LYR family)